MLTDERTGAWNRLSFRLLALLTFALLPIGFISIYQTEQVIAESQKLRTAALLSETVAAVTEERALIERMIGSARGLAVSPDLDQLDRCRDYLFTLMRNNPRITYLRYVDGDGRTICAAGLEAAVYTEEDRTRRALTAESTLVEMLPARVTGDANVIVIDEPVRASNGSRGFITLAFPVRTAASELDNDRFSGDLTLFTLDGTGAVITATVNGQQLAQILPVDRTRTDIAEQPGGTFIAQSGNGENQMFAVVPVVEEQLIAVGTWPVRSDLGGIFLTQRIIALVFPVLMWIAGIVVAYYGLQRLVIRHIKQLRSAMRQFALGQRGTEGVSLDHPPEELKELERAFNRMALILSEAEARQKSDLEDKELLLREVHHRVKNNLQLIASIMNMQSRSAKDPEVRRLVSDLQRRVNGLSMLYRTLYTRADVTKVDARELVLAVIAEITRGNTTKEIEVDATLDSVSLVPDQAVPLSMFLNEALTNAIMHSGAAEGESPEIKVMLREHLDGKVDLTVTNSKAPAGDGPAPAKPDGIGIRLMDAFVRQLEARQVVEENDSRRTVSLIFDHSDPDLQPT